MFADAPIDAQSITLTVMELFSREPRFAGSRSPFKPEKLTIIMWQEETNLEQPNSEFFMTE